ncbi:basic leucine zipper 4 [Anaeramoeba ignava]|uniref:Basic leucine zipper 4 n=1 Tax=Anaeramoeba ignava TaxID=1746090 RepID=A0A9Q0LJC5_ANAIG|nr:basic leucine zipper 4 [Anaeramoeba ignava]
MKSTQTEFELNFPNSLFEEDNPNDFNTELLSFQQNQNENDIDDIDDIFEGNDLNFFEENQFLDQNKKEEITPRKNQKILKPLQKKDSKPQIDLAGKMSREQLKKLSPDQKKMRRLLKNRKSAKKSRERIRKRLTDFEEETKRLKLENFEIREKLEFFVTENSHLKKQIQILTNNLKQEK